MAHDKTDNSRVALEAELQTTQSALRAAQEKIATFEADNQASQRFVENTTKLSLNVAGHEVLHAIFQYSSLYVLIFDTNGIVIDCNAQCETLTGYTREEILNAPGGLFTAPGEEDDAQARFDLLISGQQQHLEIARKIRRKDGGLLVARLKAAALYDSQEQITAVLVILEDITELKKAEDKLAESEELFRIMYKDSPNGTLMIDLNGSFIGCNHAFERLMGYTRAEILQREVGLFTLPEDQKKMRQISADLRQSKSHYSRYEHRMVHKDGHLIWVIAHSFPLKDPIGAIKATVFSFTNINAQKQIEQQLTESEARFRDLYENSVNGIILQDIDGSYSDCNRRAEEVLGYTKAELLLRKTTELTVPEERTQLIRYLSSLLKGEVQHIQFECSLIHKQGHRIQVAVAAFALKNSSGAVTSVVNSFEDITERKRAEQLLIASETRFRALYENSLSAILLMNLNGHYIGCNKRFEEITGYSEAEVLQTKIGTFSPPDGAKHARQDFNDLSTGKIPFLTLERPFVRKDGSKILTDGAAFVLRDQLNEISTIVISFNDITERKQAEQQLVESERLFRAVFEDSPAGIVIFDTQGQFTACNEQYASMLGYTIEEALKLSPEDITLPEEFDEASRHFSSMLNGQSKQQIHKRQFICKDGSLIYTITRAGAIKDEAGEVTSVISVVENITELMHTQTQLREHRDALARSNMELRHSNEELEQFAYIASHDLQEPLNTVTGFANLLMMDYGSVLDEVGKQYLTHMIQSTGRMQDLIAALLDYSRLGRNQQTAMIDCTKLVEKVLADLSSVILTSQAIIHTGSLPTLIGYEQELERLFQNLIKNALKFQPPSAKPSIEITSEQCEEGWQFSVKDNGIGIAPEFHQKIFAIFQRLHTRDKYEGTGIGLSQCRKIIELHNGRIWVESAPGQGCTFYFILPRLIAHGD